jgi:hypothetical protein
LLEKDFATRWRLRTIGDRHHARTKYFGDAIAPDIVSDLELLRHEEPAL